MKKMLLTLIAGLILATGCSNQKTISRGSEFDIKKEGQVYTFRTNKSVYTIKKEQGLDFKNSYAYLIKEALHKAEDFGRERGYPYMAIVNYKMNNLSGYPINNENALMEYFNLYDTAHFKPNIVGRESGSLIHNHRVKLKVVYLKEKIPGLFLWRL